MRRCEAKREEEAWVESKDLKRGVEPEEEGVRGVRMVVVVLAHSPISCGHVACGWGAAAATVTLANLFTQRS